MPDDLTARCTALVRDVLPVSIWVQGAAEWDSRTARLGRMMAAIMVTLRDGDEGDFEGALDKVGRAAAREGERDQ